MSFSEGEEYSDRIETRDDSDQEGSFPSTHAPKPQGSAAAVGTVDALKAKFGSKPPISTKPNQPVGGVQVIPRSGPPPISKKPVPPRKAKQVEDSTSDWSPVKKVCVTSD